MKARAGVARARNEMVRCRWIGFVGKGREQASMAWLDRSSLSFLPARACAIPPPPPLHTSPQAVPGVDTGTDGTYHLCVWRVDARVDCCVGVLVCAGGGD